MKIKNYPCLCLCFGLEQIMRTFPLRLTTLQLSHIFLTDDLTFITLISKLMIYA